MTLVGKVLKMTHLPRKQENNMLNLSEYLGNCVPMPSISG